MKGNAAPSRAEVCVVACAEAWRGDGEVLASPIGIIPAIGARLAALTFEPDLVVTDGDALCLYEPIPVGAQVDDPKLVECWLPFGKMFDVVWAGRRHVMMGATQLDRYGNQNIACIGSWVRPKAQLLGVRGAPGNTVNHTTSYWVPNHSRKVFVERVDFVSGVGYDRAAAAGPTAARFHRVKVVVSNLGTFDFETPGHRMRVRSIHPGVTLDEVIEATGFDLEIPDDVSETRLPTREELRLIREVLDPAGLRNTEVPS